MRPRLLASVLLPALLFLIETGTASAQLMRDHDGVGAVRGFHGKSPLGGGGVRRSFQSDSEAKAEFDRILAAVGLSYVADRIALRASAGTSNAEAGIDQKGERFIFYNATFMQKLRARTADQWSLLSILAHELGHHVAFHTEVKGNDHKFELEADRFSGFVLRRLGATLDQSHAAMRDISPEKATSTHPGLDERLQVITLGWTEGGSGGGPKGFMLGSGGAGKLEAGPVAAAPPRNPPVTGTTSDPCQAANPPLFPCLERNTKAK